MNQYFGQSQLFAEAGFFDQNRAFVPQLS